LCPDKISVGGSVVVPASLGGMATFATVGDLMDSCPRGEQVAVENAIGETSPVKGPKDGVADVLTWRNSSVSSA
jgi:hypothetical protein